MEFTETFTRKVVIRDGHMVTEETVRTVRTTMPKGGAPAPRIEDVSEAPKPAARSKKEVLKAVHGAVMNLARSQGHSRPPVVQVSAGHHVAEPQHQKKGPPGGVHCAVEPPQATQQNQRKPRKQQGPPAEVYYVVETPKQQQRPRNPQGQAVSKPQQRAWKPQGQAQGPPGVVYRMSETRQPGVAYLMDEP